MQNKGIIREIRTLHWEHRKAIERQIDGLGIHPSQHHLLMYLAAHGSSSQRSIATAMGVSAATIAVSLKKLEKCGYIEKKVDAADNRFNQILLTKCGEEVVAKSERIFQDTDEKIFDGFSESEKEQLHSYLRRMLENIKKMEETKA